MSQQDENSSGLTQQIEEQEEFIQSLLQELRRTRYIECPTLRGIATNFLQAIISRALAKTQTIETKTTKLNSTSGSGIRTPLLLELGPVTIMTITTPEVSKGYNIFLL